MPTRPNTLALLLSLLLAVLITAGVITLLLARPSPSPSEPGAGPTKTKGHRRSDHVPGKRSTMLLKAQ